MKSSWAIPTGSLVLGGTAYGFLIVAARTLEPAAYAPLAALWALVFAIAPALFMPLEQEVTRQLAREDEQAPAVGSVLRAGGVCAAIGVITASVLALPWARALQGQAFDGSVLLMTGLAVSVIGYALTHLVRGILLGTGSMGQYGASLAAEGLVRLALAVGLAAAAVTTVGPYGLVLGLAPLVAAVALLPVATRGARALPRKVTAPRVCASSMLRSMSLLALASLLSLGLINAGPVAVKLLAGPEESAQAGRLLAALVLARLPLFAFPTLQAALLPRFARLASVRDRQGLLRLVRNVTGLHVAATAAAVAVAALLGQVVLEFAFGRQYQLPRADLALLTAGAAGHLLAMLLGLALVAQGRSGLLAACWGLAAGAAGLTLLLVQSLLLRVELALLLGAWTAVLTIGIALTRLGSGAAAPADVLPPVPAAP